MTISPTPTTTQTRHAGAVLTIILVSYFMIVLDNSIIFTGLPQIATELNLTPAELSWVQNSYTLVFGGLLLLGARAGDILGRRRVFIVGLAVFGTASFLVGAAQSEAWIIAARAFQGVGAAIVAPTSLALVTATIPAGRERTRAVAAYGATAGIGASLGMVVGGALAQWVSWRAGFYINVPIAIAMILAAVRYLPGFRPAAGRFDIVGAITSTVGMGAFVYGIVNAGEEGWDSPVTITAIVVVVVVLVGFVLNEWRAPQPVMPLRLFASRERSGAAAARLLFAGTMLSFFFFTTQYLQGVYGWTPLQAGLAFLPMTVGQFLFSLTIPRLTRRFGDGVTLTVGLAFVLVGLLWLTRLTPDTSYLTGFIPALLLIGVGQGLAFGPITAAGIAGARPEDAGAASGVINTAHQLGSTLGIAILTTAAAGAATLADQVVIAYTGGTIMIGLALVVTVSLILPADLTNRRAHPVTHVGR